MTTFTSPHGLPIIEPSTDNIRDGSEVSALASDLNAISLATNSAIGAEGARAVAAAAADASAKDAAIDAKATSAVSTANNALAVSSGASADADNAVDRVTALESAAGFGPSTPTDGTMANFIANPASLTAGALSAAIAQSVGVDVRAFGAKGDGSTNDTAAIQAAIDSLPDGGTVVVPGGTYMIRANVPGTTATSFLRDEGGIALKDGVHLQLHPDAILKAFPTSQPQYNIIRVYAKTGWSIKGGKVVGERSEHTGSTGEWGYGIAITAGSYGTVDGVTTEGMWGDGINLQQETLTGIVSTDMTINRVTSRGNRRQGMSIEGGRRILVCGGSVFEGTSGTAPGAGIDIEPFSETVPVEDITIRDTLLRGNAGSGILAMRNGLRNLTVESCVFDGNLDSEAQLKAYTGQGQGFKFISNLFINSPAESIRMAGGSSYLVEGNRCDAPIRAVTGPGGAICKQPKVVRNTVIEPSGAGSWAQIWMGLGVEDAEIEANTVDSTQTVDGEHGILIQNTQRARVVGNKVIASKRGITVSTESAGVQVGKNELDNIAILPANINAPDSSFTENIIAGGCQGNDNGYLVYIGADAYRARVSGNDFLQAPRIAGAGSGRARIAVSWHEAVSDAVIHSNRLVKDGARVFLHTDPGAPVLAGGYLAENGAIPADTTARRPVPTSVGYQFFDRTLGKTITWKGDVWVDATGVAV